MSNIATTISQSRTLVELGLDPNSADMYYPYLGAGQYGDTPGVGFPIEYSGGRDIPAWSFSRLLDMMPKMEADSTVYLGCVSTLIRCKSHDFMWQHDSTAAQPIDAAYEMVCWLLEQGMINKGGEQ